MNVISSMSTVRPGDIFKTYLELCAALNIVPAGSKGKPAQVRIIEQYIKYKRSGRSYIIEEVYDKPHLYYPIPKRRDRRKKLPKKIYSEYIKALLLQELLQNNGTMIRSRTELMRMLGMINISFNDKKMRQKFLNTYPFSKFSYSYIKNIIYFNNKNVLDNSLRTLEHHNIITTTKIINLIKDGKPKGICRIASRSEVSKIIAVEQIYQNPYYFNSASLIQYQRKMKQVLNSLGYDKCFYKIKIQLNPIYVIDPLPASEIEKGRELLNEEIIEGTKRSFLKRKNILDISLSDFETISNFLLKPQ